MLGLAVARVIACPPMIMEFPCAIQMTSCAVQAPSHWKQMQTHAPTQKECLPFKITWAKISWRDARFIYSLHMGAVVLPLLTDRDMFRRCFDLGFMIRWPRQNWPLAKRTYADTSLSKYIMGPVFISKPYFDYMVQCEFQYVMAHITECVSNVKWAQNVFS